MARRADPKRIYEARRAGNLSRLEGEGEGELPDRAEAWIARWEVHADAEGKARDADYWNGAWDWMAAQRAR